MPRIRRARSRGQGQCAVGGRQRSRAVARQAASAVERGPVLHRDGDVHVLVRRSAPQVGARSDACDHDDGGRRREGDAMPAQPRGDARRLEPLAPRDGVVPLEDVVTRRRIQRRGMVDDSAELVELEPTVPRLLRWSQSVRAAPSGRRRDVGQEVGVRPGVTSPQPGTRPWTPASTRCRRPRATSPSPGELERVGQPVGGRDTHGHRGRYATVAVVSADPAERHRQAARAAVELGGCQHPAHAGHGRVGRGEGRALPRGGPAKCSRPSVTPMPEVRTT